MNGYVITDSAKKVWVCKDKSSYTLSTDPNKAHIFENQKAATTALGNSLPKIVKSKVSEVKAVKLQVCDDSQPVKVINNQEIAENEASKYIISVLSDAVSKLSAKHTSLTDKLSTYDRQRTDIEHYIEFNAGKLNACDGYKAYKLLQDVLIKRRKVKDELQIVQVALDRIAAPEELSQIDRTIKELEARTYKPRELTYLFK